MTSRPRAVLIDADAADAERTALEVRLDARLGRVPILALRREIDDLSFAQALAWSADDVVRAGATGAGAPLA